MFSAAAIAAMINWQFKGLLPHTIQTTNIHYSTGKRTGFSRTSCKNISCPTGQCCLHHLIPRKWIWVEILPCLSFMLTQAEPLFDDRAAVVQLREVRTSVIAEMFGFRRQHFHVAFTTQWTDWYFVCQLPQVYQNPQSSPDSSTASRTEISMLVEAWDWLEEYMRITCLFLAFSLSEQMPDLLKCPSC